MKLSISKELFIKGLQMVQSVISTHSTVPILYNVQIKAEEKKLIFTATDLTVSLQCRVEADVKKTGSSTFQAKRLFNIIRELPAENVDFEVNDKDVATIQCGSSTYKLFGLSADEYPPLPPLTAKQSFVMEQNAFREMLRKTAYAASIEEARPILNGVLLSVKNQKLTAVATDGRRLALVEHEIEIPKDVQVDLVIPNKTIGELIKLLKDEGAIKILALANTTAFEMEDILVVTKLIEGNYPNFAQVIPGQCEERVAVERETLLAALRRVALLTNEKYPAIKMILAKNQMQISAETPEVGEAHEPIPVKYTGKSITMAFNPEFLMDPLRNLTSDEIGIELVDELSPAVVKCDIPFLYVLMPLRLS